MESKKRNVLFLDFESKFSIKSKVNLYFCNLIFNIFCNCRRGQKILQSSPSAGTESGTIYFFSFFCIRRLTPYMLTWRNYDTKSTKKLTNMILFQINVGTLPISNWHSADKSRNHTFKVFIWWIYNVFCERSGKVYGDL